MISANYQYENKPMRQFKFILALSVYLIIFCYLYLNSSNISIMLLFICIQILFCIKYLSVVNKMLSYASITKTALQKQRDYFINSLNHDLRIPVIAQLRAIELLNKGELGNLNELQKDILSQTEQSGRCILNLISLLINTYSIENSTYKLIYKKFNLYETTLACFEELLNEAAEKNITFEYNAVDKNISLAADKDEIKKVIKNLLISAMESSNSGSIISVMITKVNKKLQMSVKIKENNNNSFDSVNYDARYTAIGQSIRLHFCKKIIEMHKGQIIQNNNLSKTFIFELPQSV